MTRTVGVVARGIRTPIIKQDDDLAGIIVDSLCHSMKVEKFSLNDKDVLGITESLLARAQGNYATVEHITKDINRKFKGDIAVIFPILSRNRFSLLLKSIALTGKNIYLFLSYPTDEMGNCLMDRDIMYELNINPYTDSFNEIEYRKIFGETFLHTYTGVDYVKLYKDLAVNDNIKIYFTNDPKSALDYSKEILVSNIHDRQRTKEVIKNAGAQIVYGLDDILNESIDGSGFNPKYGLLGSNKATRTSVKLFPRDCYEFVNKVQVLIKERTGKLIEVMIYGDGAFKDPQGSIWELADPVVSPGFTDGLRGMPNEVKLKYIADNELKDIESKEAAKEMAKRLKSISSKDNNTIESIGTTPRQITDLLGSLCDLVSGSGDKGTPIVLVQGYFDNYASE
ncbi:MAG: coenzyme F420-0:L-glutamate ligase [Firmicutes bacterium]|nr:coenzyme F420-0:L-glutamate ligase [Bacillota bacterium]